MVQFLFEHFDVGWAFLGGRLQVSGVALVEGSPFLEVFEVPLEALPGGLVWHFVDVSVLFDLLRVANETLPFPSGL